MATPRSFDDLKVDAYRRLKDIELNGETPSECHFLVTPSELDLIRDQPPFMHPYMNLERTFFFGMRLTVNLR